MNCYSFSSNWDVQWSTPGGASTEPCSQIYKARIFFFSSTVVHTFLIWPYFTFQGEAPSDAPETVGLATFIDNLASSTAGVKMFTDWHSYSQLFMSRKLQPTKLSFPKTKYYYHFKKAYGYDCSKTAPNDEELGSLSTGFITALKNVYGTQFTSGPVCTTLYPVTGSSVDYSYDVSYVVFSFFFCTPFTFSHFLAKSNTPSQLSCAIQATAALSCLPPRFALLV